MRNITIFSTQGINGPQKIESSATHWGELRDQIKEQFPDINLNSLKAVEGIGQHTLESSQSTLPEGEFTLFLMPSKTKSGIDADSMGYWDLRNAIHQLITQYPDQAASFFNTGRNYTNKSANELRRLYGEWMTNEETDVEIEEEIMNACPPNSVEIVLETILVTYSEELEKAPRAAELINEAITVIKEGEEKYQLMEQYDEIYKNIHE